MADLTHDSPDDGFHEIQLSGKQLVFLFMATTVISVVIFLCGVLVGRGVRAEGLDVEPGLAAASPAPEPASAPPAAEILSDPPAPAESDLTYATRLEGDKVPPRLNPPAEDSVPVTEIPAAPADTTPSTPEPPAPAKPAVEKESTPPPAAASAPRPGTWAVQIMSLRDRSAANQIVQRLQKKGYPAFLVSPAAGAPTQLYKVQVGRYADRDEAQKVGARLKKEEQTDTWIVR